MLDSDQSEIRIIASEVIVQIETSSQEIITRKRVEANTWIGLRDMGRTSRCETRTGVA